MKFIDETVADLEALIALDFGPLPQRGLGHEILLNWMHYRARLIPFRPRRVAVSPQVEAQRTNFPAIDQIRRALEVGADVSPWLSERVRAQRANPKADLMFNDWQVSHFHLGNIIRPGRKIRRTRELLFVHVRADRAIFLDVQPHGAWSMQSILEILYRISPTDLPEMKDIVGSRNTTLTDDQLWNVRRNGHTAPIQIGDKVFLPPGLGLITPRHALRLSMRANHLVRTLVHWRGALASNDLPRGLLVQLAGSIGIPIRLGIRLNAGCLTVYEKLRGIEFAALTAFE
jgi:hypothetical protein